MKEVGDKELCIETPSIAGASDSIVKAEPLVLETDGNSGPSIEEDGTDNSDDDISESESSSSSSDSSGDSDSSGNDSETEEVEIRDANIEEMACDMDEEEAGEDGVKMVEWSDADEEEEGLGVAKGPIQSKNELKVLPPVPAVDATLLRHHQMLPVGIVLSIVGAQIVVEGVEKHTPLNEGSILWITVKRSPLGFVDEIFGPVQNPYYVVRYNSESEVPAEIHQGTLVSFVPEFAQHVLNDNLYKKGYDASGENDEELTDEAEFSDDEKEAEYRKMQKMCKNKRGRNHQTRDAKRNNTNKNKNHNINWNNNMPSNVGQLPSNRNQHNAPAASTNNGSSSTTANEFANGVGFFPQMVPFQSLNGGWLNGLASQQPNGALIPANNMAWPAKNQPFQQQFNLSQGSFPNGGQMNPFGGGPSPMPDQNCLNQVLLGMGFQMQPTLPILNLLGMMHNQPQLPPSCNSQPQVQHNCNLQLPSNSRATQQLNYNGSSSRGKKSYGRGGGRFSGGRGH